MYCKVIQLYIYIYVYIFFIFFSITGYYKVLNVVSCVMEEILIVYLFIHSGCVVVVVVI